MAETIIALWDRGGSALLIIAGVYLLLKYMLGRVVKAFDDMTKTNHDDAQAMVAAFGELSGSLLQLTERVSRVEGKVEAFGMMAVRATRQTRQPTGQPDDDRDRAASAVERTIEETFGETPITGVHPIPTPPRTPNAPRPPVRPTPPKGLQPLGAGYRAPTKGK